MYVVNMVRVLGRWGDLGDLGDLEKIRRG